MSRAPEWVEEVKRLACQKGVIQALTLCKVYHPSMDSGRLADEDRPRQIPWLSTLGLDHREESAKLAISSANRRQGFTQVQGPLSAKPLLPAMIILWWRRLQWGSRRAPL